MRHGEVVRFPQQVSKNLVPVALGGLKTASPDFPALDRSTQPRSFHPRSGLHSSGHDCRKAPCASYMARARSRMVEELWMTGSCTRPKQIYALMDVARRAADACSSSCFRGAHRVICENRRPLRALSRRPMLSGP